MSMAAGTADPGFDLERTMQHLFGSRGVHLG